MKEDNECFDLSKTDARDINIIYTNKDQTNLDENSLIASVLDILNFKKFLKTIFSLQKWFQVTDNLINVILLFLFLLIVFWSNDILNFNKSVVTTLGFIALAGLFELLGANTSIFRGIFVKDEKTKSFLEKISSMSKFEIEEALINTNFSSACLDYFINQLEDKNKYPPEIVYLILDSQTLRTQNLKLLFSQKIVRNLHPSLVMRVMYRRENSLDTVSINNIYNIFKENTNVVKVLFATQKYSDCLSETYPDKTDLKDLFDKYQVETTHLDLWLKIYPYSHMRLIFKRTLLFLVFVFWIVFINTFNSMNAFDRVFISFLLALLIVTLLLAFLLKPLYIFLNKKQYEHYIHKVTTS